MSSNDEVTNKQVESELEKIKSSLTETTRNRSGVGICGWMFLIFMTLKLVGVINWSWWWVTAPLWIPFSIVFIVLMFVLIVVSVSNDEKKE